MPMPPPPIPMSTLLTPVTAAQIRTKIVSSLVTLGVRADLWPSGGVASTIITVVAALYAGFMASFVAVVSAGFLPTATAGWLTWVAFYFYGLTRQEATFATGELTLTNTGGGIWTFAPFAASFASSVKNSDGAFPTYTNAEAIALGSGPSSQTFAIQATEAGAASNASPGTVTTLVTSMLGVTANNAAPVRGLDAQSDESLRGDCFNRLGAASVRGPSTAYLYYATHAANNSTLLNSLGSPVNLNRVSKPVPNHTGQVTVTLASPTGVPIAEDVTAAAASMNLNARPQGVTLVVQPAAEVDYLPTITIWARALPGLAAPDLAAAAADAVSAYLATYPVGGLPKGSSRGLFATGIEGVIKATSAAIFAVDGATDLPLVAGQVAVDRLPTPLVRLVTP